MTKSVIVPMIGGWRGRFDALERRLKSDKGLAKKDPKFKAGLGYRVKSFDGNF